jgi:ABC-type Fe3+ transport system permease subunit
MCWVALRSKLQRGLVLALVSVGWVTPAPLVGLGLMQARDLILSGEEAVCAGLGIALPFPLLGSALYDKPSPLPALWAWVIRFFPIAVALVWGTTRDLPRHLLDTALLDQGRWTQWRAVIWPHSRAAFLRAAIAVGVLSLGEVVATKLVQPPGRRYFAQDLFNALHYGGDATANVLVLLQVAATGVVCLLFLFPSPRARIG